MFWVGLAVVATIILSESRYIKLLAVNWLATSFLLYRLGLALAGFEGWCSCLGTLTTHLPIGGVAVQGILLAVAVCLFVGSGLFLLPYFKKTGAAKKVWPG